jgi:hypothetical protein
VAIPNGVTRIGDQAFYGCKSLTSITIPSSVTSIRNMAFYYCTSLTSITIPNSVTSIGESAFSACSSLTSVTINSDAIVNKAYTSSYHLSGIFGSQVTKYIIGDNVKGIGDYAFCKCFSLTSVTIPNSVTSIGDYAFDGCTSLSSIVCEAITPPTCENSVFNNTNDCPIFVPSQSVDEYKAAEYWSSYADRIQAIQ